jgi:hypothetical protein
MSANFNAITRSGLHHEISLHNIQRASLSRGFLFGRLFVNRFSGSVLVLLMALGLRANGQMSPAPSKVDVEPPYDTSNWLSLLMAAEGGGGSDSRLPHRPTAYAGAKFGFPIHFGKFDPGKPDYTFTVDLGYDRIQSRNGVSSEVSAMFPVFRFPRPQPDENKNFVRIYAEPGVGYRWGGRAFGGYGSAKVMIALFSDKRLDLSRLSPFVEFQHRFFFAGPLKGDNRVAIGVMLALCNHCGLD